MGLRPTQGNEKRLGPATTLYGTLPFPLSSRAAGSLRRVGREMTGILYRQQKIGWAGTRRATLSVSLGEVVIFLISHKRAPVDRDGGLSTSRPPQPLPCPLATVLSFQQPSPFCHPERTRISYFTALTSATFVVLPKENHMQLIEATTLDKEIRGSRGICSSADPSWICSSTERTGLPATRHSKRPRVRLSVRKAA